MLRLKRRDRRPLSPFWQTFNKVVGLPLVIITVVFSVYDGVVYGPIAEHHLTYLSQEFKQIKPIPQAVMTGHDESTKSHVVLVESHYYSTTLTYRAIRSHYDHELIRHGWHLQSETPARSVATVTGDQNAETNYTKGDCEADLYYTPDQTRLGQTYVFDIFWHGGW